VPQVVVFENTDVMVVNAAGIVQDVVVTVDGKIQPGKVEQGGGNLQRLHIETDDAPLTHA
jgi:hypothetical protein